MKRIAMIAGGLLVAHLASAGVYVELVDHNLTTGETKLQQKLYVQAGNGRFVDSDGRVSLIKGDSMYVIDDADKTYIAFDKATMDAVAKQVNAKLEEAKEQMAKLPPEQRAQMEQMMGAAMGGMGAPGQAPTVDVADTGKSDKVDGRACRLWDVTRHGELDEQICVVPYATMPGKEDMKAVFAKFAKIFDEMAKSIPMMSGSMSNEFSAHVKTGGFPVRSRPYDNGKLLDEETLVKTWREETMPDSLFDIPAGYKQKQMAMGPSF
jgi:hypothetical protein